MLHVQHVAAAVSVDFLQFLWQDSGRVPDFKQSLTGLAHVLKELKGMVGKSKPTPTNLVDPSCVETEVSQASRIMMKQYQFAELPKAEGSG